MPALHEYLAADHDRLDALLIAALRDDGTIDHDSYAGFRRGLLRHISIEERVLFAELRKRGGETALSRQLHRDHAALCALLVPPPGPVEILQIAAILRIHNDLEERAGGLYEFVESLAASELDSLLARVRAIPEVKVAPHVDSPLVRRNIAALLQDAENGRNQLLAMPLSHVSLQGSVEGSVAPVDPRRSGDPC
jgi:hypothetical protein